jgi:hypothetical protein
MYEVLCEQCWYIQAVDGEQVPAGACPECGATGAWLGPFAEAPHHLSRRDGWPVLTSPLYAHAGRTDRRARPR